MPISYADSLGWPSVERGMIPVAPVRVGVDRRSGKMLFGWPHTLQSVQTIFLTRFHERKLRQWHGSFVPHLLGQSFVGVTVTRFFWAIATGISLQEPNYDIRTVNVRDRERGGRVDVADADRGGLTSVEEARLGHLTYEMWGAHIPRGHLGDMTEADQRSMAMTGAGNGRFEEALR